MEPMTHWSLYVVRYAHHGDMLDTTSWGATGEAAFQRYVDELKSQGEDVETFEFIKAMRLNTPHPAKAQ